MRTLIKVKRKILSTRWLGNNLSNKRQSVCFIVSIFYAFNVPFHSFFFFFVSRSGVSAIISVTVSLAAIIFLYSFFYCIYFE